MNAERHENEEEDNQDMGNYGVPMSVEDHNLQQILASAGIHGGHYNLQELMGNDGLNDEIKKLLADANF